MQLLEGEDKRLLSHIPRIVSRPEGHCQRVKQPLLIALDERAERFRLPVSTGGNQVFVGWCHSKAGLTENETPPGPAEFPN